MGHVAKVVACGACMYVRKDDIEHFVGHCTFSMYVQWV